MLATILLFVLLFICLFIFVFCKGCLCNHLSGVIIFSRTTEALSCRGLLQPYSGEGGNSSFLSSKRCYFGAKRSILRGRLLILKKNLIQFIAVTNLTAVKIEERKEIKFNSQPGKRMATSINILGIQRLLWSFVRCRCSLI